MPHRLDASFYVDEPPEIEYRDGLFFIVQMVGGYRFERVMRPNTLARTVWRFEQALALFRRGDNVIELKSKVADEELPAAHG